MLLDGIGDCFCDPLLMLLDRVRLRTDPCLATIRGSKLLMSGDFEGICDPLLVLLKGVRVGATVTFACDAAWCQNCCLCNPLFVLLIGIRVSAKPCPATPCQSRKRCAAGQWPRLASVLVSWLMECILVNPCMFLLMLM